MIWLNAGDRPRLKSRGILVCIWRLFPIVSYSLSGCASLDVRCPAQNRSNELAAMSKTDQAETGKSEESLSGRWEEGV